MKREHRRRIDQLLYRPYLSLIGSIMLAAAYVAAAAAPEDGGHWAAMALPGAGLAWSSGWAASCLSDRKAVRRTGGSTPRRRKPK